MTVRGPVMSVLDRLIEGVIQDVCELPDRTSPEDQPEMMLVTGEELDAIIRNRAEALGLAMDGAGGVRSSKLQHAFAELDRLKAASATFGLMSGSAEGVGRSAKFVVVDDVDASSSPDGSPS